MALLLGPDPAPAPGPLAVLLFRYRDERTNMGTTNTATPFLFPGGRPGQHVTAAQLGHRLRQVGVTRAERLGSLTHLLNEVPAPVVAKVTGYAGATTAARTAQNGTDWTNYIALRQPR